MPSDLTTLYTNMAETPYAKEIEKRTGVKVTYIHPTEAQRLEQFNLMVAAGDLPDMIQYSWFENYPGGPARAIEDKVIRPINDLIEKNSPNLKAYLAKNPGTDKLLKTDESKYIGYPDVRLTFTGGYGNIIRKDWIEKLGMELPQTVDEWYAVLKAFQAKFTKHPLTGTALSGSRSPVKNHFLFGAYGIWWGWYVDGGKVRYGQSEQAFRNVMSIYRKWYVDGLIDPEIVTNDKKAWEAKMLNGQAGVTVGWEGSSVGQWLEAMKGDPSFNVEGLANPVSKRGEKSFAESVDGGIGWPTAVTTKARNPEACATFADYGYGEKGHMLQNFGVEGETYTLENGVPKFTDLVYKNPKGLNSKQVMELYLRAADEGMIINDRRFQDLEYFRPQQQAAMKRRTFSTAGDHNFPSVSLTTKEGEELAVIMTEVQTFVEEAFVKFLTGITPLEDFDGYFKKLDDLGIKRAIQIQQAAYDRFVAR